MTVQLEARPTTYNGIAMRSRLEARVASWLDDLGVEWTYEPRAYASNGIQYLPDFELRGSYVPVFLEVRGLLDKDEEHALRKRMARAILPSVPRAILLYGSERMLERGMCCARHRDGERHGWWFEHTGLLLYQLGLYEELLWPQIGPALPPWDQ